MVVRDVAQLLLQSIEFHPESSVRNGNGHGNGNGNADYSGEDFPATADAAEVSTGKPVGPTDPDTT
jgi:hypothetical protein